MIGAKHLDRIFDERYYEELKGGILNAFGKLFDTKTRIFVYPYKSESICQTTKTFHPDKHLKHHYQFLLENKMFVDILGCDEVDTSIQSADVRNMLSKGDENWEKLVPETVRDLIKTRKLFGFGKDNWTWTRIWFSKLF